MTRVMTQRFLCSTSVKLSSWKQPLLEVAQVTLLKYYTFHPDINLGRRKAKEAFIPLYPFCAKIILQSLNVLYFRCIIQCLNVL